jgi:hypothetical protein
MLYFSSAPVAPDTINQEQYSELQRFRQLCEQNGLCGNYSNIIDFKSDLNRQLHLKLNSEPFIEKYQPDLEAEHNAESTISMSEEAQKILYEVSKSGNGRILLPGWGIQIGHKPLYYGNLSPRERAAFEGAIDELERLGFIKAEGSKREIFNITRAGYQAADKMNI